MNQMNKDSNSINITGLTDEEVRQRVEKGLTNRADIYRQDDKGNCDFKRFHIF